jgi:hypothetical protein
VKKPYHEIITKEAIASLVSNRALEVIVTANIGQDALRFQIGHDHFHYDSNAFARGDAYLESQHGLIKSALSQGETLTAWRAFGRLSHAVQDFYAHSNYVALWLARQNRAYPDPEDIEPLDHGILASPALRSGKPHVFDLLLYLNSLPSFWLKLAPKDSHLAMNIDGPERPHFNYAFSAALKRTRIEFKRVVEFLPADLVRVFTDLQPN